MTNEHEASRTLVKSPPELWAECSDPESLGRHLGEFGEITITRLEPENAVAWEGEHASGTVRIEPSAWGTRVTLTAQTGAEAPEPPAEPEAIEETEPAPESAPPEPDTYTEEPKNDATPEETLEDPDPLPVADVGPARARWRRITARFRRRKPEPNSGEEREPKAAEEEPQAAEEPGKVAPEVGSLAPPWEAEPDPEPEPAPSAEPEPVAEPEPDSESAPAAESLPLPGSDLDAGAVLTSALDSLGQAHHRPFSRA